MREATLRREGIEGLNPNNDDQRPADGNQKKVRAAKQAGKGSDAVGKALRSAYDETLREDVPDDFLDLLGKLS